MKTPTSPEARSGDDQIDTALKLHLEAIEGEDVPDRLKSLAQELRAVLRDKNN